MSACYVESNFPVTLLLAYKYGAEDNNNALSDALLKSANAGGENVNRNALLGTIVGAANGMNADVEQWAGGLVAKAEIDREIDLFLRPLEASGARAEL